MACDVTLGRKVPCKDVVGGITRIWFVNFGELGTVTQVADEITDMTGTFSAFQYDIKGTSSLEQAITSSRDTGTTFVDQTLSLSLPKLSKEDNLEVKLLAYGRPQIVVEDYNSNFFMCGLDYGCELTGGTIATGAAMGDMSGYTLTFLGSEKIPANFINGATSADPFAGMAAATVTIVVGTNS
tara:strand:+ start:715 stop:1263 length:549 start_codon:yes stop_codon:yes gene_type:complete